ncbi:MAG TPA: DUF933 domain-containing protein [Limnochordales bacterium]
MRLGLVSLPMAGKSTLMAAAAAWARLATRQGEGGAPRAGAGAAPPAPASGVVVARIPDERVDWLAEQYRPRKVTHATIEWVEVPALAPAHLQALHRLDAVALVVRAFDPEQRSVPHPEGRVDPVADFRRLWEEWLLLDWSQVQGRIERLRSAQSVPKAQRRDIERELSVLERCLQVLEQGLPLSKAALDPEEAALLKGYSLVTFRPVLLAVNLDDAQLAAGGDYPGRDELQKAAMGRVEAVVDVAARLELELAELDAESREAFAQELHLTLPVGVERLGRAAYDACGFIAFLTAGEDEVRAWTITRGTVARDAAGKVHSDIARGFIRAEVVAFDDLKEAGSLARARERGLLRLEGKDYVVKDGDVIEFRFNV